MRKIALIFPGVGYTKDRPLLYYSGKLAANCGYELKFIDFSGLDWSKEKLKDHAFMLQILDKCMHITEEALKNVGDLSEDKVVFISKSIGTVVATAYARKKSLNVKQICFSPLEMIGNFVSDEGAVLFCGDDDPFANFASVEKTAKDKRLEIHRIAGGNHSLETGDICTDIDNLKTMMQRVADLIANVDLYNIPVQNMDGSVSDLSKYRNKVLLIVNTATGCGFTPQYEALERMYRTYKDKGFAILDFPCNQFDRQAPGPVSEIHSFCTARYDISFDQFAKIKVNGPDEAELYTYLKSKQGFHGFGDSPDAEYLRKKLAKEKPGYEETSDIKWNFTKFLVNRYGKVIARFEPSEDINLLEEAIKNELQ
jgi:glutathione peroxidase-family protein